MKYLIVIVGIVLLGSCHKKLSREQAFSLLNHENLERYEKDFTHKLSEQFQLNYFVSSANYCSFGTICAQPFFSNAYKNWQMETERNKSLLNQMAQAKLINLEDSTSDGCCLTEFKVVKPIHTDPMMQQYAKTEEISKTDFFGGSTSNTFLVVKTQEPRIDEQSLQMKIVEEGKKIVVEFNLQIACNEMGQKVYAGNCNTIDQGTWIATIELYDSGWRITDIRKRNQ